MSQLLRSRGQPEPKVRDIPFGEQRGATLLSRMLAHERSADMRQRHLRSRVFRFKIIRVAARTSDVFEDGCTVLPVRHDEENS